MTDKQDSEQSDVDVQQLAARIKELETQNERLQETVAKMLPDRRQALKALAVGGTGAGLGAALSGSAAGQQFGSSTGQVGTNSEPVNEVIAATGTFQSLSTDDIDIAGSGFASQGDFLAVGPSYSATGENLTDTSGGYTGDASFWRHLTRWDRWLPDGAQGAVVIHTRVEGDNGDVRLYNQSFNEVIAERTGISTNAAITIGPVNYTPGSTTATFAHQIQVRTGGSSTSVDFPTAHFGIQL